MSPITISKIDDIKKWNSLLHEFEAATFLQSYEWGEVQKKHGYEILRLCIHSNKKPVGVALTIFIRAKRGNMIFIPHGPVMIKGASDELKKQIVAELRDYLTGIAREKGYHFLRIAPIWEDKPKERKMFSALGFRTSPIYMHAERVWILKLEKTEDELLKDMRKTTRYSIRKAEKEGVVIQQDADFERFWSIYEETAQRENFTPFSKEFIQSEYEEFHKTGNELFLSGYLPDGKTCAASALIVFTKEAAFYHQGATTHSKIPVSYLLQWRAIQEAKKRGCKFYNFWGILQPGRTPKNWGGLSLFKQGFGGFQKDYVPTQDYVVAPLHYWASFLFETFLNWKRGV